jgi:hypothetical protein
MLREISKEFPPNEMEQLEMVFKTEGPVQIWLKVQEMSMNRQLRSREFWDIVTQMALEHIS